VPGGARAAEFDVTGVFGLEPVPALLRRSVTILITLGCGRLAMVSSRPLANGTVDDLSEPECTS